MEKPERLLYIYTRLLNGKTISKEALSQKLQVNIRTIQRDISEINNFIYEDHEWHGLEGKEIYDTTIEKHRLKIDRYKFKNNRLLNLIFRMKDFTPVIHEDTYNLIRGLNANSNLAEKLLSNKLLSQFKIHRELNESILIYKIQLAIENNHKLTIQLDNVELPNIIPIYTRYFDNVYWITYLYEGEIYTRDLTTITDIKLTNQVFERDIFNHIKQVKLLVKDDIWPEIKRQFIILDTTPSADGTIVNLIISKEESMHLAYLYPQAIILLQPQSYVDEFKRKIQVLFNNYDI
ncbi:HTH domain-containing protein [Staphylococcus saprophyticus]|nr:HTH domain-containing protein [Staphylococcus saprophyticus]